jgi:2-C-methyl-D-erythritol 4-phosphate cytidylyltransferase
VLSCASIIVAAGSGSRFGGEPKQFQLLAEAPLLAWSCNTFLRHGGVSELVVVVPEGVSIEPPDWLRRVADRIVAGGASRRESVALGLEGLSGSHDLVLVHDGARPFATPALIDRVLAASIEFPAIPGLPLTDTVKMVTEEMRVLSTLDRDRLRTVQTPQGFPLDLLRELHSEAEREAIDATDDARLAEIRGYPVRVVEGIRINLKVTTPEDMALAHWLVSSGRTEAEGIVAPSAGSS